MDQTELSDDMVSHYGQAPIPPAIAVDTGQINIDDLLTKATTMANQGGKGAHADDAETWLNQQLANQGSAKPAGTTGDPDLLSDEDVKPISQGKELGDHEVMPLGGKKADFSQVKGGVVEDPSTLEKAVDIGNTYAKHGVESISNLFGSAGAYFKDFGKKHETFEPGPVTLQEKIAAKLMGMKMPGADEGVSDPNSQYYDPAAASQHGSVYKMSPEQRQEMTDKAMEAWGFTPKEERQRVEASARGDWKDLDVIGGVTTNSLMANMAERVLNPQIANTRKYYALQDTVKAMDAVANPDKYSPEVVKESAAKIEAYKKELGTTAWNSVKDMWHEALKEPGKTVKSLGYGIAQDPELFAVPEAKLGTMALAPKIARAGEAAVSASKIAKLAESVGKAAESQPEIAANAAKNAEVYSRVADRAGLAQKSLQKAANLGDTASVIAGGAGVNAGIAAEEQMHDKGYVREGSLGAPAIAGAAFGAVARAVGHVVPNGGHADLASRVEEGKVREVGPDATHVPDVNEGKKPGEPLSPETPINKNSHVPYYGGVDATGKVIHIDENTPSNLSIKNLDGKKVNIPVLKTVAYHEQVEFPLMHMEGPIAPDTLQQLQTRIGKEGTIPSAIIKKLKNGESLSYPEAHEIATMAENHLVRTLYKTDPKVYQDSLKPYIKDVGKASKDAEASDIPPGLDSKPYDDMGHPEVLKGAGDTPPVDAFHGTSADIDKFGSGESIGPHFGTAEQADKFAKEIGGRIYPVKLALKNPLRLPDGMWENPSGMLLRLLDKGIISEKELDTVQYRGRANTPNELKEDLKKVADLIRSKGYDSIVYDNIHEGTGDSYIALNPREQVKFRTTGESGKVNKKLLATGVTVGAGVTGGALLAPQGQKETGAILGGAAGLFAGMNMWGDSIKTKGLGNKERGMFAGPLSRSHDTAVEAEARSMKAAGKTPEQINFKTGMYEGAGGHFYSEVSDNKATVEEAAFDSPKARVGKGIPLSEVLDHTELEKAYPGLADKIHVRIDPSAKGASYNFATGNISISPPSYYPSTGLDTFRKVLLHEVNHAIQHYEGFPRGDSPARNVQALKEYLGKLDNTMSGLIGAFNDAKKEGNTRYMETLQKEMDTVQGHMDELSGNKISEIAWDRYNRSAGENMSVATQERADLSPEQRRMQVTKTGTSVGDQIVRYNNEPSPHLSEGLTYAREEGVAAHELPLLDSVKDNYRKNLGKYTDEVYHESNINNILPLLPKSRVSSIIDTLYTTNNPDLALGQGGRTGVLVKFDATKLEGQVNRSKPTWEHSWEKGDAEFTSDYHKQSDYQKAVKEITVKANVKGDKVERIQLKRNLGELEATGWTKEIKENGDTIYTRPEEGLDHHELPLQEQLKKTGDADEDGNLHGMVLDEDRLPNEHAVVELAKKGDQKAITTLYKKYMPRLERTLRSMMRDAGPKLGLGSEDIASQAFMKATQALPSFEGNSAFYTWLYKIGRNEALNAIGKGDRQVKTSSMFRADTNEPGVPATQGGIEDTGSNPIRSDVESIASTHDTPEAMATAQQASNMVRHAIGKLPQDIREAVKMKELAGMTEQEIATAQGIPLGTVKSRLSRGREMIQQSLKRGHGAQFRKQGGFATPEALKKLAKVSALAVGGGTLGAMYLNTEHPIKGAWAGAALALVGGEVNWGKLFPSLKQMMGPDKRVNVNALLDRYDAALATSQRTTAQVQYKIDKLAPNKGSQAKITQWLDGDKSVKLTQGEYDAARVARQFYDSLGHASLNTGVLKDFLQDYINHEWGDTAKARAYQDQVAASFPTNMSPKDRHALARKFMTLAAGKAAGLVPKTENVNELIGIYSDSMSKAMANKTLLDALKVHQIDPVKGIKAVMPSGKAPYNFVPIQHPQLNGVRVHPSIAPSLDFLFHTTNRGVLTGAIEGLNTATKRLEVSLSLFHVKALVDAFLGANPLSHPVRNLVDIATSMAGKSRGHSEYITGGAGDTTDLLISNGLRVDPRKGKVSDEDVNTGFYEALDGLQRFMNQTVPGSGKAVGLVKKANKLSDKFIWENVHTGLKLTTAMNAYERLSRSHAQELLKDPSYQMPSSAEIAKQASSYTNDTFGGLNWRRLADDAQTKMGRNLALGLASPAGRRLSQVMMFAPDWTYSTIRSFIKAAGPGSGLKGLFAPKALADLHRQYLIRSSIIYLTLYNAVNMAMSGHPIWDNEDPLTVDLGNGERMQANKHFMETPHMFTNPAKFAIGKLGIIPSEVLEQAFHKEYLTTGNMPEMKEGRLQHAAGRLMPFSGEALQSQGTPEMIMNMLGFPIYGKHAPRTQEEVDAASEKKHAAARKGAETRRAKKFKELYGE